MNAELLAELEAIEALSARLLKSIQRLEQRLHTEPRARERRQRDRDDDDDGGD